MTVISARNTGPTSHATARNPASTRTAAPAPTSITIALGSTGNRRRAVGAAGAGASGNGASGNGASGNGAPGREAAAARPVTGVVMPETVGSAPRPRLTPPWW